MNKAPKQDPATISGSEAKNAIIGRVNAQLATAGLPTYSDLIATIEALTACTA